MRYSQLASLLAEQAVVEKELYNPRKHLLNNLITVFFNKLRNNLTNHGNEEESVEFCQFLQPRCQK